MATSKRTGAVGRPSREDLQLERQLCFPLYVASRMIVNAYRPLLDPLGLTYPQYLVMLALWEEDGQNVGSLGDKLHLDSGTLTPLLKRMERLGLVTRRRSPQDERVVLVQLADAGKALKKRAVSVPRALLCQTELEMGDVLALKAMLDRLISELAPLQRGATDAAEPEPSAGTISLRKT